MSDMIGIGRDPRFDELRSDRRFQALVQRLNAPNDSRGTLLATFFAARSPSRIGRPDFEQGGRQCGSNTAGTCGSVGNDKSEYRK